MSLRDELIAVRSQFGALTPANVVDAARPDDHPLHSRFEWDDEAAAEKYRLVQASDLIRKVKVTYATDDGESRDVRAFLVVRGEDPSSEYVPTEDVMADPFAAKLVLQEFEREWKSFKARYEHLREFQVIVLAGVKETAA